MAIIRRRRADGSVAYGVQVFRGNGVHEWVGTRDTRREAKALEREEQARRHVKGDETVAGFCDRYLDDFNYGGDRWGEEAERNIRYALKKFKAEFGTEKLGRFPTERALPWASRQPESTVRIVRALFNDAIRAELAPSNPFAGLGLERSRGRADIVAITEEELHVLAEVALGTCGRFAPAMHALILFQGYVGCRPKETFNLTHRDVDHEGGTVYVAPSKNGKARTIILPPQPSEVIAKLPRQLGTDYVFTTPKGSQLTKTSITYWWNKCRDSFEAKLDPRRAAELRDSRPRKTAITLYELRHTAATVMLERGIRPEDVAKQLGHKDGSLVENLYGHPREAFWQNRIREGFQMAQAANG